MRRPNPFVLAAGLLVFVAIFGGVPLLKGGLYLDTHEGDSYHLMDILLRLQAGQMIHQDFHTPLGILAFFPISTFMDAGFSVGRAIGMAQVAVALFLLPFVVYVARSRLSSGQSWIFGGLTLLLVVSLSFAGTSIGVSMSMYYNRWAWSVAFVAIALALLPSTGREWHWFDGILIGAFGAILALLKVTYFVAFAPGVLVAVAMRWKGPGVIAVLFGGVLVSVAMTVHEGIAFWPAYLADLQWVSGTELRPTAGLDLSKVIAGNAYLGPTLIAVAALFFIRRTDHLAAGQAILLIVPGFFYVTYQNFGNEPQWLWLLAVLLFALRPVAGEASFAGRDLRGLMMTAGIIAIALSFPSVVSHGLSPLRHASYDQSRFLPLLPDHNGHQDFFIREDRAYYLTVRQHLDRETEAWGRYTELAGRNPLPEFQGHQISYCQMMAGSRAYNENIAESLRQAGVGAGDQLLLADALPGLWMFGPFTPLHQGGPWYYGGLTGLENADYVVVPKCAFVARFRNFILKELTDAKVPLTLKTDNEVLLLFSTDS